MSSYYRIQLEDWLKKLDVNADRVLDVGGSQLPVRDRVKAWTVNEYRIIDLPVPHKGATPNLMWDINNDGTDAWPASMADIVFCLEVMEYVYEPMTAIKNLAHWTKPGGTLYITFPYYYPPHEPLESDYLRYTLAGARKLLENGGFRVDEVFPRRSRGLGLLDAISENALRLSKRAGADEANMLGFIIKATKL